MAYVEFVYIRKVNVDKTWMNGKGERGLKIENRNLISAHPHPRFFITLAEHTLKKSAYSSFTPQ